MVASGLPTPFDEAVLDLVDAVPAGCVVTYGDVAAMLGRGGPRQVGHTMSRFGSGVPWWRVVRADGTAAPEVAVQAAQRWAAEAMPRSADGRRVDLAKARWTAGEARGTGAANQDSQTEVVPRSS